MSTGFPLIGEVNSDFSSLYAFLFFFLTQRWETDITYAIEGHRKSIAFLKTCKHRKINTI